MKNMAFNMHAAAQQTLKKLEEGRSLAPTKIEANTFSDTLFESKTLSDATFLINLGKEIGCNSETQELLFESVQLIYERAEELLQTVNMRPRMVSVSLQGELNESTSLDIYSKYLTDKINKDFTKPLFEGTLLETNKEESKKLLESLLITEGTESIDEELFLKYAIFENSLMDGVLDIVLSKETRSKIDTYISLQESEYFKIFDRNAQVVLDDLVECARVYSSLVGPTIFEESLQSQEKVDVKEFAGISKAFKK